MKTITFLVVVLFAVLLTSSWVSAKQRAQIATLTRQVETVNAENQRLQAKHDADLKDMMGVAICTYMEGVVKLMGKHTPLPEPPILFSNVACEYNRVTGEHFVYTR